MSHPISPIILSLVILAYALTLRFGKFKPARFQTFTGWQKLAGAVALIIALLIVLNPEFLALGLVGDTAFFDLLVFAITLQLQGYGTRAWRSVGAAFFGIARWLLAPRPTFAMFLLIFAPVGTLVTSIQKLANRILSDRACLA
jgi:hypothetical protein